MRLGTAPATAFFVFLLGTASALADVRPIKGETIKSLISGGTVILDTPIGATLPLNFAPDGTVSGSSVMLAFYLGSTTDRGRWWIDGNKLCTKFTRWFDREQSCLTIRPEGRKFAWTKDDGDTGTASIISNSEKLYGSASALGAGSAAAMVRNAEVRAAAKVAKPVQLAMLQVKPQPMPQVQTAPKGALVAPVIKSAIKDDPSAWLPMSVVKSAIPAAPVKIAYTLPPAAEPVAVMSAPSYRVARVGPNDVLNVRGGPKADSDITGSIPSNARGLILKGICQSEWCPVAFDAQYGWVNRQFIELE
jgi:hypothetical protein